VVHGKGSLLRKMSGDEWQRFANLRALLGYMYGSVGKKMLFMGIEVAQWEEWAHDGSVAWDALDNPQHVGVQRWVTDLNRLYRSEHALFERDDSPEGFAWIAIDDADSSVFAWERYDAHGSPILIVAHLTPMTRNDYRIGVDRPGRWEVVLNSDADVYGGGGAGPSPALEADEIEQHGRQFSLSMDLPPLGIVFLRPA
jgi:1,4-alpha-glucan branching enzyme